MSTHNVGSESEESLQSPDSATRRRALTTLGTLTTGCLAGCNMLGSGQDSTQDPPELTGTPEGADDGDSTGLQLSPGERQRLAPDRLSDGDRFGAAVSLGDGTAIVGAPGESERKMDAGVAYVLEPDAGGSWRVVDELMPETATEVGLFGWAVAHADGHALIGAYYTGEQPRGGLFWFRERDDGWERMGRVDPEPAEETNYSRGSLGWAVAMDGEHALVGEPDERAYFLRRTGDEWVVTTEVRPETAFDNTDNTGYGRVLTIKDGIAAVGAPNRREFDGADIDGITYVYEFVEEEWRRQAILRPAESGPKFRSFGHGLALADETLLVGAPSDAADGRPTHTGIIHVFDRDGGDWSRVGRLTADTERGEELGRALAASETRLVSGGERPYETTPGGYTPPVFTFSRDEGDWRQPRELSPGQYVHNFGIDVDVAGRTAIIGTQRGDQQPGPERGSAYLFGL